MVTRLLGVTASLILGVVGIALANGSNPTKFTVRIENITKPEAFTADFHFREEGSWQGP
jgi:hypothetical protein